ncbi:WD repeat protein [Aspergillus mulundensis]|uniref:WD repeat-containing protein 75 second beta-propeller domain-containing protein n=1 Tax=Aspergillus mulundensis TaxID=1810919 RepID=A0A3D8QHG1_9EURO|nr:hypothetical protein DSM5745_10781 [Aspergillus mulundensis]RDW61283.1 hypothetical protein DSM5745_10781 [Aspergillus mulundensis]
MSAKNNSSPARLMKRSRASEAAVDSVQVNRERTKRRRTSTSDGLGTSNWSLSRGIAGHFAKANPILTPDEQYIILGLETAVQIYSVATSRLFRIFDIGQSVSGFVLNQDRLFIVSSSGSISEWDWPSRKQVAQWDTAHGIISADLVYNTLFSLRKRKDGMKELVVMPLDSEKPQSTIILETHFNIDNFRVTESGKAVVAYGGACIFVGTRCATSVPKYTWKEIKLAISITCIDIKQVNSNFDLVLGGTDGSILVYHAAFTKGQKCRRLHWHRDPVTAVRWSKDGNYVISGGYESVMVLWQLDTGRKQFLPHLSSPICNIVVSESGNSYAVSLADNRVVVLSARELQPLSTITSLQLATGSRAVAAVHPQHPEQLLIAVPSSGDASCPILQTYDIRSGVHISRQALARTNATTLNIGPDGTHILPPDINHFSISEDGKWMATVDSWWPEDINLGATVEEYLKFWRWNESSSLWQLVTRIDSPHISTNAPAAVLDVASRPNSHEFATIGSDGLLRLWRPVIRQRLRENDEHAAETWKCRNVLDLKADFTTTSASICFSADGSVLAVSTSTLTVLVDVRSCSVRCSKVGAHAGDVCANAFLGCHLLIAAIDRLSIWDTVNDAVRTLDAECHLLAVNPRTQTFATAGRKKKRIQIFDINATLVYRCKVAKEPVSLLSNSHSTDYVIVDAGANVQQISCSSKTPQVNPLAEIEPSDLGLDGLFGRQSSAVVGKASTSEIAVVVKETGLAGVFGDTPPFVLPPSRVVFRDLVKALSA